MTNYALHKEYVIKDKIFQQKNKQKNKIFQQKN